MDMEPHEFAESVRGRYIISQALYYAIETMCEAEDPESSNIEDMRYLREHVFPLFRPLPDNWEELLDDAKQIT